MPKILIVGNTGYSLYGFRLNLLRALCQAGWEVVAVAHDEADFASKLAAAGMRFLDIPFDHKGKNPLKDLVLIYRLVKLYRRERPAIVHHFTIKPVIFGTLAAKLAGVPKIVNTITGLGYTFQQGGWLQTLVKQLYKVSLAGRPQVIFQNHDDCRLFLEQRLVASRQAHVILGSGINTRELVPRPRAANRNGNLVFLLVGRMLWSKGIREYVEAAAKVKACHPECFFLMVGGHSGAGSAANPEAIPTAWLDRVRQEGVVHWLGAIPNTRVLELWDAADVAILPSYCEGLPKSLLEAAAKGKPLIATDTPGCREVVHHGLNGFLVPVKNSDELAAAMLRFIARPELLGPMGAVSRKMAEHLFDEHIVINKILAIYQNNN